VRVGRDEWPVTISALQMCSYSPSKAGEDE